jgi:hypothetical protein
MINLVNPVVDTQPEDLKDMVSVGGGGNEQKWRGR